MFLKFAAAPITLFGLGCRRQLPNLLRREGVKKALIVTDASLEKLGIRAMVTDVLEGFSFAVFSGVCPNPTLENAQDGLALYQQEGCDFIIAVGGGSANDCAKAIRVMAANGGELKDYQGPNKSKVRGAFLVAVNTTAGTASEVSRAYLISDEAARRKLIFKDDFAMPDIAVDDTELMLGLPAATTAQTGMDALTHAIESYCATSRTPLTDLLAEDAMHQIWKWLPAAVENGSDEQARDGMALGQYLAGLSFGNAGLGLVHAMAHQLSAVYHMGHGLSNAVLLPTVLEYYRKTVPGVIGRIAQVLAPEQCAGKTPEECDTLTVTLILQLSQRIGTDMPLSRLGVTRDSFAEMADKALQDGCLATAPSIPDHETICSLYEQAL